MNYLGKIAGAFIGLITGFGLFGLILGIILGHLADQLIGQYRTRKKLTRFYLDPSSFPLDASEVKTAGMVGLFCCLRTRTTDPESIRAAVMKHYITEAFRTLPGISVFFLNLCAETCVKTAGTAGAPELARVYTSVTGMEERKSFIQFLLLSFPEPGTIRPIIPLLHIRETWFNETAAALRPGTTTLQEDCTLLGVTPETGISEIKKVYRRLAAQFHPDGAGSLMPEQQRQLNETFIRIHGAYLRILKERSN